MKQSELRIRSEIDKYMFLHTYEEGHKGGQFVFLKGNRSFTGGEVKIPNMIYNYLSKGYSGNAFVSLNTYRKSKSSTSSLRSNENLWGIDTIMIDIDGNTSLCGREEELENVLRFAWENDRIPVPNLISYTGGGGIHLYYAIKRLPGSMANAVKSLKLSIADLIKPMEKDFPFGVNDETWHVDFKVFDDQRMDRIPGSINPKTGNMCICHIIRKERYEYKYLRDFVNADILANHSEISQGLSAIKRFSSSRRFTSSQMTEKKIINMINMVRKFRDYYGRREIIAFMIRNWCKQLNYDDNKSFEVLRELNNCFSEPLPYRELIRNTKVRKVYRLSNEYIIRTLDLSLAEIRVLFPNYRPNDQYYKAVVAKRTIANLVLKGYSCSQISKVTDYSLSIVKRRRAEMSKGEGFEYWATYSMDGEDNADIRSKVKDTANSNCRSNFNSSNVLSGTHKRMNSATEYIPKSLGNRIVEEIRNMHSSRKKDSSSKGTNIIGSECDYIISLYEVVGGNVENSPESGNEPRCDSS